MADQKGMMMRGILLGSVVVGLVTSAGGAAPVPVVNGGFEDITGEAVFNEFTFGPPPGWGLHDPDGVTQGGAGPVFYLGTLTPFEIDPINQPGVYGNFPGGAAEGSRVAIAFNFAGSGGEGEYGIEQALGAVVQAGMVYTLRVEVGNIGSGFSMSGQFFDLDGFPGYRIELLAGGEVVASDVNSLAGLIPEGEWATSTVVFSACPGNRAVGEQLGVRLVNLNVVDAADPGADLEVDFDDVRLDVEPGAFVAGDLDGDGAVGSVDLNILLGDFGCTGGGPSGGCAGDADGDGDTDSGDLNVLLAAFGASCG